MSLPVYTCNLYRKFTDQTQHSRKHSATLLELCESNTEQDYDERQLREAFLRTR